MSLGVGANSVRGIQINVDLCVICIKVVTQVAISNN